MKLSLSSSASIAVAMSLAFSTAAPAAAAPVFVPQTPVVSAEAIQVQARRDRHWRDQRRDRFERRGDRYYLNGYRGYREPRRGYRHHRGWWFPPAAFALGAIIGGALAQQTVRPLGNAHIQWCYNRYRSYRASDNTFQPYQGPRRPCISPYMR
jgi:hypothetical protein